MIWYLTHLYLSVFRIFLLEWDWLEKLWLKERSLLSLLYCCIAAEVFSWMKVIESESEMASERHKICRAFVSSTDLWGTIKLVSEFGGQSITIKMSLPPKVNCVPQGSLNCYSLCFFYRVVIVFVYKYKHAHAYLTNVKNSHSSFL